MKKRGGKMFYTELEHWSVEMTVNVRTVEQKYKKNTMNFNQETEDD
jgi:hypothetical protein